MIAINLFPGINAFGNGSDGAGPSSGVLVGTVKQYTNWTVTGAVTCSDSPIIYVKGDLDIQAGGSIVTQLSGAGPVGWNGATVGGNAGNGQSGTSAPVNGGAGGGSGGGNGVNVSSGGYRNTVYTEKLWKNYDEAAIGGDGGDGGALVNPGGTATAGQNGVNGNARGRITILVGGKCTIDGDILANGTNGSNGTAGSVGGVGSTAEAAGGGGGGGGAGGGLIVLVVGGRLEGSGNLEAKGGNGGNGGNAAAHGATNYHAYAGGGASGSGGGGGAVILMAPTQVSGSVVIDVSGGARGSARGVFAFDGSSTPVVLALAGGGGSGGGGGSFANGGAGQVGGAYDGDGSFGIAGSNGNSFIFTGHFAAKMNGIL